MNGFVRITCPYCGENFEIPFDPSESQTDFIVDCEICCRPISVAVRVQDGEVEELRVSTS